MPFKAERLRNLKWDAKKETCRHFCIPPYSQFMHWIAKYLCINRTTCPPWAPVGDWWELLMGLSLSVVFWVSTLERILIKKAQLIQPEAVKKCWQQAASRRTKCRPRCINKDIKNQMSLRKWTAEHGLLGDIEGEKIPLCKSVDEFPQEIFKNALFHRWMDSFCRYSHLNSEPSCQNLHFQKTRFKTR